MSEEIIIDVGIDCTRTAIMEDGQLTELYIEKPDQQSIVGNIYMGKVKSILRGMQAAFIDIGTEKNAFLFLGNKMEHPSNKNAGKTVNPDPAGKVKPPAAEVKLRQGGDPDYDSDGDYDDMPSDLNKRRFDPGKLREGNQIIIQVRKESYGTKGPRVSTDITLPGRYTVLLPEIEYAGVSRRIESQEERDRLKNIIKSYKPAGMGVIARTAAEGKSIREIARDIRFLVNSWKKIKKGIKSGPVPRCLYKELDLAERTVRDMFTQKTQKLVVNDKDTYGRLYDMVKSVSPALKKNLEHYNKDQDIFEFYNIEAAIDRALARKVRLKSGGYIVIDNTEALTVIDVNTGQFTGKYNLEDTVLKTNIEATAEIARQLRLRDIGGIIIIDYIDMHFTRNQRAVLRELRAALKKDRIKSGVLGITGLGLVEMTREKKRKTLDSALNTVCPYCEGTGKLFSPGAVIRKIEKQVASASPAKKFIRRGGPRVVKIEVDHDAMAYIKNTIPDLAKKLQAKYKKNVEIVESDSLKYKEIRVTTS
ncbi:MAG: Rne/Rng family ribonuclease [Eubacteriales bacterium]|nr:Rne/Rng family ribonuclease [Eubacteriales bacterium]